MTDEATTVYPKIDEVSSGGSASSGDESENHPALIVRFLEGKTPPEEGPKLKVHYGNNDVRDLTTLDQLRHHRLLSEKRSLTLTDLEKLVITKSSRTLIEEIKSGRIRVIDESNCVMKIFGDMGAGLKVHGGGGLLWVCNMGVDYVGQVTGTFEFGGVRIHNVHCEGLRTRTTTGYRRLRSGHWYWLAGDSHPENKGSQLDDIYNDADQAVDDSFVSRSLVLQSGSLPSGLIGEQLIEGHIVCVRGDTCVLNAPHVGCRAYCKLNFYVTKGGECNCIMHIPKDVTVIPGHKRVSEYEGEEFFLSQVRNPWPVKHHFHRTKLVRCLLKANSLPHPLSWKDLCLSTSLTAQSLASFIFDYAASLGDKSGSYIPWTGLKTWKIPPLPVNILSNTCIHLEESGWVTRSGIPLTVKTIRKHPVPIVQVKFNLDGFTYAGKAIWAHNERCLSGG